MPNNQIYFRAPVIIDNTADYLSFGSRTGNFLIKLSGEDYGFGINGYTLRYNCPIDATHRFYTGANNIFNVNSSGINLNNIISTKAISLYDAATPNNFQFVGSGNNNGLCINTYQESDAFQFKVGTSSTTSKEVMRIQGNGKVGIGTNNPNSLLHLRGAKPATLKIETNNSDIGEVCCIEFGIPAFLSSRCAKILSTTYGGDKADI